MKFVMITSMLPSLVGFRVLASWVASADKHESFLQCLLLNTTSDISVPFYTQQNSSYASVLQATVQNLRFNATTTPKPLVIVTPLTTAHVQATVTCARKHDVQIRIRSGGHDYEGLSYVSPIPFVVLDLTNFRNITVDATTNIAWVQAGATLGEFYYRIAEKSRTLAFPAGACPTVGVGGHFSGGGYGFLLRKYGLAADHIVDAHLIDANGQLLDRASMGEDLFWAIRGGGGNSFGVVIAWKVNLVQVPETVTVFGVTRPLDGNATHLFNKWQHVANQLPKELAIMARTFNPDPEGNASSLAFFQSLFLGKQDSLLLMMEERFPELGLKKEECTEMSWIESAMYMAGHDPSTSSLDVLLERTNADLTIFKAKVDYVKEHLPEVAIEGLLKRFSDVEIKNTILTMVPYGGRMDEISETSLPYPHRAGNLFKMQYFVIWNEEAVEATQKHLSWIRNVYNFMTPYVSKNPREAYINYRDLDIGTNNLYGNTSYKQASVWGRKYFKNNFDKLVRVKTYIDPSNFFKNEQSIPPLSSW